MHYRLNITNRNGKWWDNFMEDRKPGAVVWDINKVLAEWDAYLVIDNDGEQIEFKKDQDRMLFLLRYS